jgi:P-type Ca2+ transporter type 2C
MNILSEFLVDRSVSPTASRNGASADQDAAVTVMHAAVRGRVRVNVSGLRNSERMKRAIEVMLTGHTWVRSASASPITGNVLILFDANKELALVIAEVAAIVRHAHTSLPATEISAARKPARPARAATARIEPALPSTPWHRMEVNEVGLLLNSSLTLGLAEHAARLALERFGPNTLPKPAPRSSLSILLGQFNSLPVLLLGASAVLSAATGGMADAVVILGVVLLNAGIGFVTEREAERTIESLMSHSQPVALVMRDGRVREVHGDSLVPGDVLTLSPGTYVPADARLIQVRELTIDESALTGESIPVRKSPEPRLGADVTLGERTNMVYMGTVVTGGSGLAMVVATGAATELGMIQALVGQARPPETPMQRQLDRLGTQMVWLSGGICMLVFGIGLLRGYGFLQMLRAAVSLAVAAVPEGLPTVATTTLSLGIRSMRRHNVLVRRLDAVETLGSVQVICLDKTGTLTINRMSVLALQADLEPIKVNQAGLYGEGGRIDPYARDGVLRLLHVAVLCNETQLSRHRDAYVLNGSATETALVQLAIDCGISVNGLRQHYRLDTVEYRAEHRNYMSTLHLTEDGHRLLAVKGAPAEVLGLCRWHMKDGVRHVLTEQERARVLEENARMAGHALRVLGFAYAEGACSEDPITYDLTWLGLAGLADPIRSGVKELIGLFHQAGIRTVMITGDQSATAYAIGKELGLNGNGQLDILDSMHLESTDPEVLSAVAQKVHIFSRVSPANKLEVVQALQHAGLVVAMTGDGINDGPALRAADIGVAMGSAGTDVAREVADVILEDDELGTMILAVSEGRTIYNNIRKSIHYLTATNLSEIAVMLSSISLGMGQPLNTMQLLWINLVTDVLPALALAVEPPEPDVLRQPPRDPSEPIIRKQDLMRFGSESLVLTAGTLAAYVYGIARYGIGPHAGTLAFTTLSVSQLLHAYSCRSDTHGVFSKERLPPNRYLNLALGGSLALQAGTLFVSGLRGLLGLVPPSPLDLAVIATGASAPFLINEATKTLRSKRRHALTSTPSIATSAAKREGNRTKEARG